MENILKIDVAASTPDRGVIPFINAMLKSQGKAYKLALVRVGGLTVLVLHKVKGAWKMLDGELAEMIKGCDNCRIQ